MAGTSFQEIFDFFMSTIQDYTLISLYNSSVNDFNTFLSAWLIQAIPEFINCDQTLTYSGDVFDATLTQKNINILSLLMKKLWLEREIDDILQMQNVVQDKDFKTFSQSQNMTSKQARFNMLKEEVSQKLVDYGLNYSVNWSQWFAGQFFIP